MIKHRYSVFDLVIYEGTMRNNVGMVVSVQGERIGLTLWNDEKGDFSDMILEFTQNSRSLFFIANMEKEMTEDEW